MLGVMISTQSHPTTCSSIINPRKAPPDRSCQTSKTSTKNTYLDHYEDPYHRGDFEEATHAHAGKNPLCGDKIHVDLRLDEDGRVAEAWFDGEGCVISQASASMLIEEIEGKTIEEVKEFSANEMLDLFGPKLTPNRQKCCLLVWKIVQTALHSPIGDDELRRRRPVVDLRWPFPEWPVAKWSFAW